MHILDQKSDQGWVGGGGIWMVLVLGWWGEWWRLVVGWGGCVLMVHNHMLLNYQHFDP